MYNARHASPAAYTPARNAIWTAVVFAWPAERLAVTLLHPHAAPDLGDAGAALTSALCCVQRWLFMRGTQAPAADREQRFAELEERVADQAEILADYGRAFAIMEGTSRPLFTVIRGGRA